MRKRTTNEISASPTSPSLSFSGISEFVCINPEVARGISHSCPYSLPLSLPSVGHVSFSESDLGSGIIRARCHNKRRRQDWRRRPTPRPLLIECELSPPISHILVSKQRGGMNMHSRMQHWQARGGPLSRGESRLKPRETAEWSGAESRVQIFLSGKFTLYTSQPPRRRRPPRCSRRRELHRSQVATTERPRPPPLSNVNGLRLRACSAWYIGSQPFLL